MACKFVGYRADSAFLYEGIDYKDLANKLYDATLGQIGTDERSVYETIIKGVGEPMKRLMTQPVEADITYYSPGKDDLSYIHTSGTYMQVAGECGFNDDNNHFAVKKIAMTKLGSALIGVLKDKNEFADVAANIEGGLYPSFEIAILQTLLRDEFSEDEVSNLVVSIFFHWHDGIFGGPVVTIRNNCVKWLSNTGIDKDETETRAAEAVCNL